MNCGPKGLPTDTNLLYRNEGDGRFARRLRGLGVARVTGRYPMSAAAADLDEDGWPTLRRLRTRRRQSSIATTATGPSRDVAVDPRHRRPASTARRRRAWALAASDNDVDGRLDLFKTLPVT